ncbi:hypothetical protein [Streptomyces sp. GbtcB7]|uniref:hypothetical protein n=1 Tax=Streptomyces sp. GbtcB7 TaxID=2824752 RepID=UPI001C30097C|nr:hypothetical protein [Streptomyces sp. GbtcB7]
MRRTGSLPARHSGAEYYYRYPNGDEVFNETAAYLARLPESAVVTLDTAENSSWRFFSLKEISYRHRRSPKARTPWEIVPSTPARWAYRSLSATGGSAAAQN